MCNPPRLDQNIAAPLASPKKIATKRSYSSKQLIAGFSRVSQGILIVSAQLKDRAVDARFSLLAIRGIDIDENPTQTRIPAEVLYDLLLFSPTPTAEKVLRELYLLECD